MQNEAMSASLLATALEHGIQIGLRIHQGEQPELRLRLRKADQSMNWARTLAVGDSLPGVVEQLCGFALDSPLCRSPRAITSTITIDQIDFSAGGEAAVIGNVG
jgi:hypothetical protein